MTSTVPAEPAGDVAVIDVALFTVKEVALVLPNFTAVAPVKLVPVIATLVPPAVGPLVGLTPVTVGAAIKFAVSVVVCVPLTAVNEQGFVVLPSVQFPFPIAVPLTDHEEKTNPEAAAAVIVSPVPLL